MYHVEFGVIFTIKHQIVAIFSQCNKFEFRTTHHVHKRAATSYPLACPPTSSLSKGARSQQILPTSGRPGWNIMESKASHSEKEPYAVNFASSLPAQIHYSQSGSCSTSSSSYICQCNARARKGKNKKMVSQIKSKFL